MMKIIVSHDVDHIYPSDHFFHDLIFPKLWIRSTIQLFLGEISFKNWFFRLLSIFDERMNRIPEIIDFDTKKGVQSTFFFGMDNILGMSYKREKARPWIHYVLNHGADAGVHGVEIEDIVKMQEEYIAFKNMSGLNQFGIRTHYVRYNDSTFKKMDQIGYLFDTSEFCKDHIALKSRYKINQMWEFPLHIMDGYVMHNNLKEAQDRVLKSLKSAESQGLEYVTFLFHDYMFNDKTYTKDKEFYIWFIDHCIESGYKFVSYKSIISDVH